MAISCEKFTQMLEVISKEHKIDMQSLVDSLEKEELLPKKMMTTKSTASKDKSPYDNKRAKEFAEANGICIKDITGTGRDGRITIADMKKVVNVPVAGKAKISGAAEKLATEHGINISMVTPSGKRGDILLKDIKLAIENAPAQPVVVEEDGPVLEDQSGDDEEEPELELEDAKKDTDLFGDDEEEPELELED